MLHSNLKQRLNAGEQLIGCILVLPSADIAEILARSNMHLVMIDHEHGSGGLADFIAQDRAIIGSRTQAMVRFPHGDYAYAQRLLDAGAKVLICPGVDTAAQARTFVHACRYPPRGSRGAGAGTRASGYGLDSRCFTQEGEDETLLVAQIESVDAIGNIVEICSVPGIDMLLIGPRDLSASIGALGDFTNPELWELVGHAAKCIREAGKYLASTLHPGRTIKNMFDDGYDVVLAGKDVDLLTNGATSLVDSVG